MTAVTALLVCLMGPDARGGHAREPGGLLAWTTWTEGEGGRVVIARVDGSDARVVDPGAGAEVRTIAWSLSGDWLAFTACDHPQHRCALHVVRADGSEQRPLFDLPGDVHQLAWLADEQLAVLDRLSGDILVTDPLGSSRHLLTPLMPTSFVGMSASPDGTRLLTTIAGAIDLDTRELVLDERHWLYDTSAWFRDPSVRDGMDLGDAGRSLAWAPDGSRYAAWSIHGSLDIHDRDGGWLGTVGFIPDGCELPGCTPHFGTWWSGDGSRLLVRWLVDLATAENPVTSVAVNAERLDLTRFAKGNRVLLPGVRQGLWLAGGDGGPTLASDGSTIALVSPDGQTARDLTAELGTDGRSLYPMSASPDGERVAGVWSTRADAEGPASGISVIDLTTLEESVVVRAPRNGIGRVAWQP